MNLITRDELRAKLHRGDEFKLVMTLSALSFRAKHIPTSVHYETVAEAFDALDPAEEIVFYCSDVYCAASIYAYRLFERQGYMRLRRYAGGIADWEEAGYPLESGCVRARSGLVARGARPRSRGREDGASGEESALAGRGGLRLLEADVQIALMFGCSPGTGDADESAQSNLSRGKVRDE